MGWQKFVRYDKYYAMCAGCPALRRLELADGSTYVIRCGCQYGCDEAKGDDE